MGYSTRGVNENRPAVTGTMKIHGDGGFTFVTPLPKAYRRLWCYLGAGDMPGDYRPGLYLATMETESLGRFLMPLKRLPQHASLCDATVGGECDCGGIPDPPDGLEIVYD